MLAGEEVDFLQSVWSFEQGQGGEEFAAVDGARVEVDFEGRRRGHRWWLSGWVVDRYGCRSAEMYYFLELDDVLDCFGYDNLLFEAAPEWSIKDETLA